MKCRGLFALKNNKINFRMASARNLLSALRGKLVALSEALI